MHFLGHGGRYVWRTGPPDYRKNHDLFTLEHLDQLSPSRHLPVVLSMTCFSAPFDHPNADSIGEKFLRLPERGAVAVLAASWRNTPSAQFSQALVDNLLQIGTVGEAIVRAKQGIQNRTLVETYNLLGDPALPIAVPELVVRLTPTWSQGSSIHVSVEVEDDGFEGKAILDWLDESGTAVASQELATVGSRFTASYGGQPNRLKDVRSVRVYVWDEKAERDGLTWRELIAQP